MKLCTKRHKRLYIEIIVVAALFGLALYVVTYMLPSAYMLTKPLNVYDEGFLVTGAKRIAQGEVPYRDFWALYQPFNYLMLSGIFKIGGESIMVERLYASALGFFNLGALYLLFRMKTGRLMAGFAALTFLLFMSPMKLFHGLLIISITLITYLLGRKKESGRWAYVVGILVGLTFITRLDFGLLIGFVAFVSTFLLYGKQMKKIIMMNAKMACGFLIVYIPILIWLGINGALLPYVQQTLYYPFFGGFVAQRQLLLPSILSPWKGIGGTLSFIVNWYFWVVVIGVFIGGMLLTKYKRIQKQFIVFFILCMGSLPYLFQRTDFPHLVGINILGLAFIYYVIITGAIKDKRLYIAVFIVPLLLFYYPFKTYFLRSYTEPTAMRVYSYYEMPLPVSEHNDNLERLRDDVLQTVDKNEPLYIGLADHSTLFINNSMLYFMLPNPIATRYHELHPGVANTVPVQREIIGELEKVDYVVLWDYFYCEPNESCVGTDVTLIDDYIDDNFSQLRHYGAYQLMKRK
ncbi:hypothetical protein GF369_00675 [Candidatus Peregrinibacteria bacterium]|nr:hypothetical protein [Candidatus Peregrinibacteria bacterium]